MFMPQSGCGGICILKCRIQPCLHFYVGRVSMRNEIGQTTNNSMAYRELTFSQYSRSLVRGRIVALFHSLKMKPLYLDVETLEDIKTVIDAPRCFTDEDIENLNSVGLLQIIDLLIENRVLNEKQGRDDEVISNLRENIGGLQILIAYFILAESCNLCCTYCFERTPTHKPADVMMSEATAFKSINFFERMLSFHPLEKEEKTIIFYGGEPLLNYATLISTLREINQRKQDKPELWNNTKLSLVTNGTLLTKERILELNSYGLEIGISIDGPEYITNANRFYYDGRGVYADAKRAIDLCKEVDVPFGLSVTLSEVAIKHSEDLMRFLQDISPSSVGFNILMGNRTDTSYAGYDEDAARFLIEAFKVFRRTGLFEDRMMRKVKAFVQHQVYPFDCGATGGSQVVFAPSGQVGICHGYLADKKYFPTTVDDVHFIPSANPVFLEWAERTPLRMDKCQDCDALGICGGGCPMNADRTKGSIFDLDKRFCIHAQKTLEWLVWDLYDNANKT
ncbi:MAG: FibroRumin system radical SAM peptide maturase [Planctomycetaceae bacterium]|jgi:uncharacterized protein|nr:FibroRumin system radical SAM peptide maturase [Planctomycetaceae bacterium]